MKKKADKISYTFLNKQAHFPSDMRKYHARDMRWLVRYLKKTSNKSKIMNPKRGEGMVLYVDVDFIGNSNTYKA